MRREEIMVKFIIASNLSLLHKTKVVAGLHVLLLYINVYRARHVCKYVYKIIYRI